MNNNLDRHNLKDMAPVIAQHIEEEDGDPLAVTVVVFKNVKVGFVKGLEVLPHLLIADFRNSGLTEMTGFHACTQLQELHLCENNIRTIRNITHLHRLKILDIRGNYIRELSQNSLMSIPASVQNLRLGYNYLANLAGFLKQTQHSFKTLWVVGNPILKSEIEQFEITLKNKIGKPVDDLFY